MLAQPGKLHTFRAEAKSPAPARPVAKQQRQELVATLTSKVAAYVGTAEPLGKPAKALTKTIKRLARQAGRQRKQTKTSADAAMPAVSNVSPQTVSTPVARPQARPGMRRPTATKRPAAKNSAKTAAAPLLPEAETPTASA